MGEDEPGYLICAPFRTYNEILVYRTSREMMANCGHRVWVAQAGRRQLRTEPGTYTICLDCYHASVLPPDSRHIEAPAPGALDEVEQVGGPAARREAEAFFRRQYRTEG